MSAPSRLRTIRSVLLFVGTLSVAGAPAAGHVNLLEPNGGEVLEVGSDFLIEWTIQISHNLQNWDLWYSTTGANGPWNTIEMNFPPGSGAVGSMHTYSWTVPDDPSDEVRVRVRMDNSATDYYDISNGNLTIESQEVCNDIDNDGYGFPGDPSCPNGAAEDCDDGDPDINPGAAEVCADFADNDCDGLTDGDDPDCEGPTTRHVVQSGLNFDPVDIVVKPGDTIEWHWGDGFHTVTSGIPCTPDARFDELLDSADQLVTYTVPLNEPDGVIPYFCIPHCLADMTGTITVQGAVAPATGLLPEDSLGITDCMDDAACANEGYCVPDAAGSFPGICYVPKNRYLSAAPNSANTAATARRLSVVTFERSCGGAGNTLCISNTECAGNADGPTCDDVRTGSQVIGWFGQPNADGYADVVDEATRHYTIWADLTFPIECGVDDLCPAGSHCDTGLGASNTCLLDANDTEVPSTVVHLSGCHISPKKRDVTAGADENRAANYYLIQAIAQGSDIGDESNYSTPLELRTVVVWGDMTGGTENNIALPPNNTPGFLNILDQVNHFKGKGQAPTPWLDLDPQVPDRGVGFLDMLQGVNGFKGQPYPFLDPCECAGLGPCN